MSTSSRKESINQTREFAFPVPIVCRNCGLTLFPANCSCHDPIKLEWYANIPRLLFGQNYWGETSYVKMMEILDYTKVMHWRQALDLVVKGESVEQHLNSAIGADAIFGLPWHRLKKVLDIGAGMGFLSCALAEHADEVVAVEPVPERALFTKLRANQDNLNVFPIIANGIDLPFPAESFDLITLNGAFEYMGLWGEGHPQLIQERFLRRAYEMLRPNGILYIGTGTRYALPGFLGGRDRSGLAFANLTRHQLAAFYSRFRTHRNVSAHRQPPGYRVLTYAPLTYRKLLLRNGFADVEVYGAFDGHNRQIALYDLGNPAFCRRILAWVDPPASIAGVMRRIVTNSSLLRSLLENEVVILASKGASEKRLLWGGLNADSVGQLNTPTKVIAVCHKEGAPASVAEAAKKASVAPAVRKAYWYILSAEKLYGDEAAKWPMRWPKPLDTSTQSGRRFFHYECCENTLAHVMFGPLSSDNKALGLVRRVFESYGDFCRRLSVAWPNGKRQRWDDIWPAARGVSVDEQLSVEITTAITYARHRNWQTHPIHGDLSARNLALDRNGQFVLIDWEAFTENGLIAVDFVRFYYDLVLESSRLSKGRRSRFISQIRAYLQDALEQEGYNRKELIILKNLFIVTQLALIRGKGYEWSQLASVRDAEYCFTR